MTSPLPTRAGSAGQLNQWRDLIRDHFVALDITSSPHDFRGRVATTEVGHLRMARVTSLTQECRRTSALARRDDQVYLQVGLLTGGVAAVDQDGRHAALRPGDFVLYETDRPFTWRLRGPWELLVFTWPRATVSPGQAETSRLTARVLDGQGGLGRIVGGMLAELVRHPPALSSAGAVQVAHEVADLVTTAAVEHAATGEEPRRSADRLRQIDAYIAEHLDDPDLDPGSIAAAHFLSTRQLHRLFAARGETVGHHIRRTRLERCRHDLRDPRLAGLSVGQVAARWGFVDLPGFTRAFRAAYGVPPGRYRRQQPDGGQAAGR